MCTPIPVVVLGSGGNTLEIAELLDACTAAGSGPYVFGGCLDDDTALWGSSSGPGTVLGPLAAASDLEGCMFVNGIGSPTSYTRREALVAGLGIPDDRFVTLTHPTAVVARSATVGAGSVLMANCTVGASAVVGRHVLVLPSAVISHGAQIGDHSCLASGVLLAGAVTIERSCYLGSGSMVRGDLTIGERALVGMGSVVLRDVDPGTTVVGNPARPLPATVAGAPAAD